MTLISSPLADWNNAVHGTFFCVTYALLPCLTVARLLQRPCAWRDVPKCWKNVFKPLAFLNSNITRLSRLCVHRMNRQLTINRVSAYLIKYSYDLFIQRNFLALCLVSISEETVTSVNWSEENVLCVCSLNFLKHNTKLNQNRFTFSEIIKQVKHPSWVVFVQSLLSTSICKWEH